MSQAPYDHETDPAEPDVVEFSEDMTDEVWVEDTSGPGLLPRMLAELAGTFILVFMGVGAALFSGPLGWDILTVPFGFAVGVVIAALVFGAVSGAHLNPAVTIGVWLAGRFPSRDIAPYVLAQVIGASAAAAVLFGLRASNPVFDQLGTPAEFLASASNHYGALNPPLEFSWAAGGAVELITTALLVAVVLAVTARRANAAVAPFGIAIALAALILVAIPFTNAALNPARATATALFAGTEHLQQLWLFWLAPVLGAAIAGLLFRAFGPEEDLVTVEVVEVIED